MTVSEVSRTPTVNGFSVVLLGRQKDREHDQQCRRVSNKKYRVLFNRTTEVKKYFADDKHAFFS